jgi:hypothetical protein
MKLKLICMVYLKNFAKVLSLRDPKLLKNIKFIYVRYENVFNSRESIIFVLRENGEKTILIIFNSFLIIFRLFKLDEFKRTWYN